MLFKKNETIVFTGDSITDCDRKKPEGEGTSAYNPLGTGFVNLVYGYLHSQYPELHLRIINQGISGNRSRDLCARFDDVLNFEPDWVFLMIGVNDVWRLFDCPEVDYLHVSVDEFRKNVEDMVIRTGKTKAKLIILSPFMMETNQNDHMRKKLAEYQTVLRELAAKYSLPFIDVQKAFDKVLSDITYHEMSRDRVHPNIVGHMIIMKTIIDYAENN